MSPTTMRRGARPAPVLCGLTLVTFLVVAGLAGCRAPGPRPSGQPFVGNRVGSTQVSVENRPAQPRLGDNTMVIRIMDAEGRPLRGADVRAAATMEAMGTMPRMENRGEVREASPGLYEARYKLNMMGEWDVGLDFRAPGLAPHHADYRLSTSVSGMNFAGGTPAAGGANSGPGDGTAATAGASPASAGADVSVDTNMRQSIGLKTATVVRGDLVVSLRLPGRVGFDESKQVDISPRFAGWVRELRVGAVGEPVRAGDVLFTVYSPELLSAQQEYLGAMRVANADSARPEAVEVLNAAHRRLRLWDVSAADIERIGRDNRAMEAVPVRAPASGVVTEKDIVAGGSFSAGQRLLRIAPSDPVWVLATVHEQQLPNVRAGMAANVLLPQGGGAPLRGRISYVSPTLSADTRTAEARVALANPGGLLKPGMFVDIEASSRLEDRVSVPVSAVIYSGERRVVFVDLGQGRLSPRDVHLGVHAGDRFEVLGGLAPGERVVVSGNFLVAAESRLKSALERWDTGR